MSKEYKKHVDMLVEMKQNLDSIFKRIRWDFFAQIYFISPTIMGWMMNYLGSGFYLL